MNRRGETMEEADRSEKITALTKRFQAVDCDVIAVQELLGSYEDKSKAVLNEIGKALKYRTNLEYDSYVGPSNDKAARLGFLVKKSRIEYDGLTSFVNVELPKISEELDARKFARGPLELRLRVTGKGDAVARKFIIVNFHFKSRAFNSADGSDLSWETYRMEMAEALRRIVTRRHPETLKGDGSVLVLLGDRNSHFDSASAKLLTGELVLPRFQGEAACRLNKRGIPLCQPGAAIPPAFVSVLTTDPQTFRTPGTYRYEDTFSWIDDILVPVANLPFLYAEAGVEGDYDSGTLNLYEEASDHALVYARFNW